MSDYYATTEDMPLFDRRPIERTDENKCYASGKTRELLDLLSDRNVHSTEELKEVIGHRFSTNINSARDQGYLISKEKDAVGSYLYRLYGKEEMVKVTDTWREAYYLSAHWCAKRQARFEIDGYSCRHCRSTPEIQVHHWCYDLFAEDIEDLVTLCGPCHERVHAYRGVHIKFPEYVRRSIWERLVVPE